MYRATRCTHVPQEKGEGRDCRGQRPQSIDAQWRTQRLIAEEGAQLVDADLSGFLAPDHEILGQLLLALLHLKDSLFDASLNNKAHHHHRAGLAQAVHPVNGLVLRCRIPPRIQQKHVRSRAVGWCLLARG